MQFRSKRWHGSGQEFRAGAALCLLAGGCLGAAGCASPGPPLPPSLNLPAELQAGELSAARVGDEVRLSWTMPTQNTDKLLIRGRVTAVVCRDTVSGPGGVRGTAGKARGGAAVGGKAQCAEVTRVTEASGAAATAVDRLPAELAEGPERLLAYRVELENAAGRTAGPSPAVYAAAGAAPKPVQGLGAEPTKAGVVLRWRAAGAGNGSDWVELVRTTVSAPGGTTATAGQGGLPGAEKHPVEVRLRAGTEDAGGTIDRTAELGYAYRYTAERVRAVTVGGQRLEERSGVSGGVEVAVRDVFAPDAPKGLVAAPGFAGEKPAIELSWEPDVEPRLAGYRVYRREGAGEWKRTGPELVTGAEYQDTAVTAGVRYEYRVTAVSSAGNESGPSDVTAETAPE